MGKVVTFQKTCPNKGCRGRLQFLQGRFSNLHRCDRFPDCSYSKPFHVAGSAKYFKANSMGLVEIDPDLESSHIKVFPARTWEKESFNGEVLLTIFYPDGQLREKGNSKYVGDELVRVGWWMVVSANFYNMKPFDTLELKYYPINQIAGCLDRMDYFEDGMLTDSITFTREMAGVISQNLSDWQRAAHCNRPWRRKKGLPATAEDIAFLKRIQARLRGETLEGQKEDK